MYDRKRKLMPFTFYDRTGIERRLEEQAEKGWLLEKCSAAGWIYRRIEPAKIHFSVVYFPAADAFAPHPSEKQKRFQEFCEHTGWELIASNVQMQIFCNRRENPIPIETDPVIEVENIHKSVKKTMFPAYFSNLVLAIMQIGLAGQRFSFDPLSELLSLPAMLATLFWCLNVIFWTVLLGMYFHWHHKAKSAALDGHFFETKSTDGFQMLMLTTTSLALVFMYLSFGSWSTLLVGILMVIGILGLTAVMVWMSNWMKKRNVSAKTTTLITYAFAVVMSFVLCGGVIWLVVGIRMDENDKTAQAETYEYNGWTYYVYDDPIPLKIEDLIDTDYEGYSYEIISEGSSPLLRRYEARQKTRYDALSEPEMSYRIVEVKASFLYDWVLELMLEDFDHNYAYPDEPNYVEFQKIDAAPWGAQEACQLLLGGEAQYRYLLCYEDTIIEIDLDWEPTVEQMAIIATKLNP